MFIAVILQSCIAATTYSKIRQTESTKRRELPALFLFAFISGLIFTTGAIISNLMWILYGSHPAISVATVTVPFFYCFFMITLLCTLVTRLYVTFQASSLRMTKTTVYTFVIIFALLFIAAILVCTGHAFLVYKYGGDVIGELVVYPMAALFYILYVIGSALSVRLFVVNLSKIAKMQRSSLSECSISPKAKDMSLNSKQLNLLHLSAKYILLFFVAIASTLLAYLLIIVLSFECRGLFMSFDLCINLFCLYLQFAFAKMHYKRCCGWLDARCRSMVLKRAKKVMHREAIRMQAALAEVSSASTVSIASPSEIGSVSVQRDVSGTVEI